MKKSKRTSKNFDGKWAMEYLFATEALNKVVIGQNKAVTTMSACLSTYVNQQRLKLDLLAPRLIIQGETSSGKTTLAIEGAKYMKLPYSVINGGLLSPEGYRGQSIFDSLKLIDEKMGHILIIDELDKLIHKTKHDAFYQNTLYAILGVLGGEPIQITTGDYLECVQSINTKNIMVICCGIFHPITFGDDKTQNAKLLHRFGFDFELVNRFSHFISMEPLSEKFIESIIKLEAEKLANQYATGKLENHFTPKINTNYILQIIKKNKLLGIRHAKALIQAQLEKYYTANAVEDMFNP